MARVHLTLGPMCDADVEALSVVYHLAPEYTFPAALEYLLD